jgi:hypothetical protein
MSATPVQIRPQTLREELEGRFLSELARCTLAEPRLMALGKSWDGVGEEHFSDQVNRDVFRQIAPVIRSEKMTAGVWSALEMLASAWQRPSPLLNRLRDALVANGAARKTRRWQRGF